jgi:hypothetical protein
MPVVIPVSDVFSFSIYHLLPLEDPVGPFPFDVTSFPRTTHPSLSRSDSLSEDTHAAL